MDIEKEGIINTIPKKYVGRRFDLFLSEVLKNYSRSSIKKYIEDEFILINGRPFKPSRIISGDERVSINIPPPVSSEITPEKMDLNIVYQDSDIAVVNKPAGLTVHPGAGIKNGTLVNGLMFQIEDLSGIGGELRPGIVHRLDRETSGLIVVAKNDTAHRALSEQFKKRVVIKEYVAIVVGELKNSSGKIDLPISRNPNNRIKMTTKGKGGRTSLTYWEVIKKFKGFSFVKVQPRSGRTHQIRVHFAESGFPILGDKVYGNFRKKYSGIVALENIIKRQALHARRLSFIHPASQKEMQFEAELPEDINSALRYIEEKSQ